MFVRVKHGENASFGEVGKAHIPIALHVLGANLVDLLEGIQVCHTGLSGRQSNNGTIFLVERVDVEDPFARYNC